MPASSARPSVLILTSNTGGGHLNMATALCESLESLGSIQVVDVHPSIVRFAYSQISRYATLGWSGVMRATDTSVGARGMHAVLYAMTRNRLAELITSTMPDLIISTHSMLSYEVTQTLRSLRLHIPVVFQITDVTLHRMWVTESRAAAYLASTREIYDALLAAGIDAQRVVLTGRPVRRQFVLPTSISRSSALENLGLAPERFTVYVQGGAEGSANVVKTVANVLAVSRDIQCVVAAGRNTRLLRQMSNVNRVAVIPYMEQVAPIMAACDVVVGKPGAGTIFESIMLEKPIIASTLIPYQETPNSAFIERHGVGFSALSANRLQETLSRILVDAKLWEDVTTNIRQYRLFNLSALDTLVPFIEGLLLQSSSKPLAAARVSGGPAA